MLDMSLSSSTHFTISSSSLPAMVQVRSVWCCKVTSAATALGKSLAPVRAHCLRDNGSASFTSHAQYEQ